MKKIAYLISFILVLTSCQTTPSSPTPTATTLPTSMSTTVPSPTPTPVPPLKGRLFFDMNGSGLQDETSFTYDPERLADPRQPLQPDLARVVEDYVSAHPDIKDGDLITIEELGLSGYSVCVQSDCIETDAQGNFSLPNPSGAPSASIKITDPNADNPALAMRYINHWKGAITVPAYTKDVDAATMARLTTIPECDADLAALVCRLSDATLQVRDQHLNDTSIIPIGKGTSIEAGEYNNVGLMQGFLTWSSVSNQEKDPFIWYYFDIASVNLWPENFRVEDVRNNVWQTYNGKNTIPLNLQQLLRVSAGERIAGLDDGHIGLDILVNYGSYIISEIPSAIVMFVKPKDAYGVDVHLILDNPEINNTSYVTNHSHMTIGLVETNQIIYRGQIIGLSGDESSNPPPLPQLHFHLVRLQQGGWFYLDPFRYILELDPLPVPFAGSDVSYWTSDNLPQFSR
jgi:hypothetical protein